MVEYTRIKYAPHLLSGDELYRSLDRRVREGSFSFYNGDPLTHWENLKSRGNPIPPEDCTCISSTLLDRSFPERKGHLTFQADILVECCHPDGKTDISIRFSRDFEPITMAGEQAINFLACYALLNMAGLIANDLGLNFSQIIDIEDGTQLSAGESSSGLDEPIITAMGFFNPCFEEIPTPDHVDSFAGFGSLLREASENLLVNPPFDRGFREGPKIKIAEPVHYIDANFESITPMGLEIETVETLLRTEAPPALVASFVIARSVEDAACCPSDLHLVYCCGKVFFFSQDTHDELASELDRLEIQLSFVSPTE